MRILLSVIAILATFGLAALSDSVLGAEGGSVSKAVSVNTQLDVHSNRMNGATFTAPETGSYRFTIVSGAFCYVSARAEPTSPYGGWLTQLQIHTKAVVWGPPDRWGKHPLNPDATVGVSERHATSAEAEAAGRGATVAVSLQKGAHVTLLVSDGSKYYRDNQGVIKIRISTESVSPPPAMPQVPPTASPSQKGTVGSN